jgi:hypothetical protein
VKLDHLSLLVELHKVGFTEKMLHGLQLTLKNQLLLET